MKDLLRLQVSPNPAPSNGSFTVVFSASHSPSETYQITNDSGQLIRKGRMPEQNRELSLSTGGMKDGVYWLVVGENRERFTIV